MAVGTKIGLVSEGLSETIIGAAIEVHRVLGPGLLESIYEEALCRELGLRRLKFVRQLPIPVEYKGVELGCNYRIDLLVEETVILELKCVEKVLPVHAAQLLTYMKLARIKLGFIFNFNSENISRSMIRRVL
jgi:GxxExxY protein